jgi:hypothetical protein
VVDFGEAKPPRKLLLAAAAAAPPLLRAKGILGGLAVLQTSLPAGGRVSPVNKGLLCDRQCETEQRSRSWRALDPHPPPMRFD